MLAQEAGGYAHHQPQELRVFAGEDGIVATLGDELLFDGPVEDRDPLPGGTVGLLARSMDRVSFDDVAVDGQVLQARALGERRAVDADGDGTETVALTAAATVAPDGASHEWLIGGEVVATGRDVEIAVGPGETEVTLRSTDPGGAVGEDAVGVKVVPASDVLLADTFEAEADGFSIVDTGDVDAPSGWTLEEGAFAQGSDIRSGQQETGFGAWSLGGEGAYLLREGTHAVYEEGDAWTDYAVEATVTPGDDDGIGLLLRHEDALNHYKFEVDAETGVAQLIRNEDGYETVLARGWTSYTPGEPVTLRVEAQGDVLTPYVDGLRAFDSEITDDAFASGTVALHAWASEALRFEDVVVTRLGDGPAPPPRIAGGPGRDRLEGTEADKVFEMLVGRDVVRLGGGDDVLDLTATVANGARDSVIVRAEPGQTLTLSGIAEADIAATSVRGDRVVHRLTEDGDRIVIRGLDEDAIQIADDLPLV